MGAMAEEGNVIDTEKGLVNVLERVRDLRRLDREAEGSNTRRVVEEIIDNLFAASNKLATYGTLAPGRPNHSVIQDIHGTWSDGFVRGKLHESGWGATMGYPAMTWNPKGEKIPVKVFVSPDLPTHWTRLDEFEGEVYMRILIPVENESGVFAVANIYALRDVKE